VEEFATDAGKYLTGEGHKDGLRVGERGVGECVGPENDDEGDWYQSVDEYAVGAFEIHSDPGIVIRIGAFADVAGCRLHGDHVPCQEEAISDVNLPPAEPRHVGKETRSIYTRKPGEFSEVHHARMEDPGDGDEGQRDHR